MVKKNIDKISDLTLSMLAYSKDREPDYEDVNITDLINEILELVEERAKADKIKFITSFDKNITTIKADYKGMFRSILNLVTNGLDALTEKENATLTINTKKKQK